MRRFFSEKETFALMEELKTKVPDIAIRTTLIVGHPGETEKEFQRTLSPANPEASRLLGFLARQPQKLALIEFEPTV